MPIYEYACQNCGYELEARQSFSDPPLRQCPSCSTEGLERLISASSFALKGSGWYADGYGGAKGDAKPADDKPAAKDGDKKADGGKDKAEAKDKKAPDAKSEAPKKKE